MPRPERGPYLSTSELIHLMKQYRCDGSLQADLEPVAAKPLTERYRLMTIRQSSDAVVSQHINEHGEVY